LLLDFQFFLDNPAGCLRHFQFEKNNATQKMFVIKFGAFNHHIIICVFLNNNNMKKGFVEILRKTTNLFVHKGIVRSSRKIAIQKYIKKMKSSN
jgi:hypothetical protein